MELPDDATKFPKLPFIIGDVVFLAVAAFLAYTADTPPSTATIIGVVICAGIGVALGVAPFLVDYARAQDQQLTERQNALEALVRTTSSAADQASIAANGLHEIAEITKRNLRAVEELPGHIQKAKAAAQAQSEGAPASETAALQTALKDLSKTQVKAHETLAAALTALKAEVAGLQDARPAPAATADLTPQFDQILAALDALKTEIPAALKLPDFSALARAASPAAGPATEPSPTAAPAAKKKAASKSRPAKSKAADQAPSLFDEAPLAFSPKSTEVEPWIDSDEGEEYSDDDAETESSFEADAPEAPADESVSFVDEDTEPGEVATADEPEEDSASAPTPLDDEPAPEPSLSSDGITRLTVTAYIGIGNRLFVRGDGPGLSPDEGTPLQFVSIGKWRWETEVATEPFKVTLWKNDQELCTSAGEIKITPGAQVESSANF